VFYFANKFFRAASRAKNEAARSWWERNCEVLFDKLRAPQSRSVRSDISKKPQSARRDAEINLRKAIGVEAARRSGGRAGRAFRSCAFGEIQSEQTESRQRRRITVARRRTRQRKIPRHSHCPEVARTQPLCSFSSLRPSAISAVNLFELSDVEDHCEGSHLEFSRLQASRPDVLYEEVGAKKRNRTSAKKNGRLGGAGT
jgi:hypothetical protein